MKKLILAGLIATSATFGANASVISFDDSAWGGTGQTFDQLDFDTDFASVTQTDSDFSGDITGPDAFSEFGTTDVVNFKLGGVNVAPVGYELLLDYNFSGTASMSAFLQVLFNGGTADLVVDTTIGGGVDAGTSTTVGSFTMGSNSFCNIFGSVGVCSINLAFAPVAGYFSWMGTDIVDHVAAGAGAWGSLIVTVQDIIGLDFVYAGGPGSTQNFQIVHDGNMTISVPEPTSIAILGLGLLGFAGARRRRKS